MLDFLAAPNTTTNDGSYWWVWLIVIAGMACVAYMFYIDKIKKK